MAASMEASLNSLASWSDESRSLKDIAGSKSAVPGLYKIVNGHYRSVGSDRGLQRTVCVHSVESSQKILAEGVKVTNNKITRTDQKFFVPLTYQGWFEVLSEDGKSISTLSTVEDIAKAFPHYCLVREDFRAPISDAGADDKITVDKTRIVRAGEKLTLRNDILAAVKTLKGPVNRRYLRCHDEQGMNVFLSFDESISISPIAGQNNISGVHSMRGLLDRFRLPVTVKLAHGNVASKLDRNWTPVFRLISTYSEEVAYVHPLKKDSAMLTIPVREPLQLVGAKNLEAVKESSEYATYLEKCEGMAKVFKNSIQPLIVLPDPEDIMQRKATVRSKGLQRTSIDGENFDEEEEELLFEEIEEIYRYVRDGGDPPAPKTRKSAVSPDKPNDNYTQPAATDPAGNYAYINDLKKISNGAENKGNSTDKREEAGIIDDFMDEPLYADIKAIKQRKRESSGNIIEERMAEADMKQSSQIVPQAAGIVHSAPKALNEEKNKISNALTNEIAKVNAAQVQPFNSTTPPPEKRSPAPAAIIAPLAAATVAAEVAAGVDKKHSENVHDSSVQILRHKKPAAPPPKRTSQIVPQVAAVVQSAPKALNNEKNKMSDVLTSNAENKIAAVKQDELSIQSVAANIKKDVADKLEAKLSTDKKAPAPVANAVRNSMFNNVADIKSDNKQRSDNDANKASPSNILNAFTKEKEAQIRNSTNIPPPISAAIARDFQINKSTDLKKDFGFVQPVKPVVAQQIRSANNFIKQEVPKTMAAAENKVNEIRKDTSEKVANNFIKENVPKAPIVVENRAKEIRRDVSEQAVKDMKKVNNKIDNARKEVTTRSYEAVGNDMFRTSSRFENIPTEVVQKTSPILADISNSKQSVEKKLPEASAIPMSSPLQNVKKEVASQLNHAPVKSEISQRANNIPAQMSQIPREIAPQEIPAIANELSLSDHSRSIPLPINVQSVSIVNASSNTQPVRDDFVNFNQNVGVQPQTTAFNISTPPTADRFTQGQPTRPSNPASSQSLTILEPQPQSYHQPFAHTSRQISPTTVNIGEGLGELGNLPIGWVDDNMKTNSRPMGETPGATAVNISNGVASTIERSVLQLSSSNNAQKVESSIVHTSGFDKLLMDEDINRRHALHMETSTIQRTSSINTDSRSAIGYSPQLSGTASSNGVTVYPDRTVLSVSNTNNYKTPGYATIKNSGSFTPSSMNGFTTPSSMNGFTTPSSTNGFATINRQNSRPSDNGVSVTTVHVSSAKSQGDPGGYRSSESVSPYNQQGLSNGGHTVLRISQQPGSSSGNSYRSAGTTYAVNMATLHKVK